MRLVSGHVHRDVPVRCSRGRILGHLSYDFFRRRVLVGDALLLTKHCVKC